MPAVVGPFPITDRLAELNVTDPPATWHCPAPAGESRTVGTTTSALQVLVVGESVPTPIWSTTCHPSAASPRTPYAHDGDADGRPPDTAGCWDSSPTTSRGRSDRCRSSPAGFAPDACPTSALDPPSRKATTSTGACSRRTRRWALPSGRDPLGIRVRHSAAHAG